jgi:hypothetical protein
MPRREAVVAVLPPTLRRQGSSGAKSRIPPTSPAAEQAASTPYHNLLVLCRSSRQIQHPCPTGRPPLPHHTLTAQTSPTHAAAGGASAPRPTHYHAEPCKEPRIAFSWVAYTLRRTPYFGGPHWPHCPQPRHAFPAGPLAIPRVLPPFVLECRRFIPRRAPKHLLSAADPPMRPTAG